MRFVLFRLLNSVIAHLYIEEIMSSEKHKILKIIITDTFQIENSDKSNINIRLANIELNRVVLERMMSQFAERHLNFWICSYVNWNLR